MSATLSRATSGWRHIVVAASNRRTGSNRVEQESEAHLPARRLPHRVTSLQQTRSLGHKSVTKCHHARMGVSLWWATLCAISVVNLAAWGWSARVSWRRGSQEAAHLGARRRWQLALSAVFVLVCAFRSIFPRADVQRICLHDSWLSSVMAGRSAATIAELCFVAQWALMLRELADSTGDRIAGAISRLLLPLIATAEVFSWYATLTTSYLGNTIEESLWAFSATLFIVGALSLRRHVDDRHRRILTAAALIGVGYVAFMCTVDVPMYVSRWLADEAMGRHYLTLAAGLVDVSGRWVVTRSWNDWRTEIPWMSLYFSGAVWASIALVHTPPFAGRLAPAQLAPRLTRRNSSNNTTAPTNATNVVAANP